MGHFCSENVRLLFQGLVNQNFKKELLQNIFFTIINLLTVAVYTLTHTHYNNIFIVKFDAEPVSEHHANHM